MEDFYTDAAVVEVRSPAHMWLMRVLSCRHAACSGATGIHWAHAQAFKAYVKIVLTRKNTITGLMYSEDPGAPLSSLQHCPRAHPSYLSSPAYLAESLGVQCRLLHAQNHILSMLGGEIMHMCKD